MLRILVPLLFALSLLVSCAPKNVAPTPKAEAQALKSWQSYLDRQPESRPFRLSLSLRAGKKGESRRVTALLWGNDTQQLRLDVQAGVGATLAKISQKPEDFLLVAPVDGKAFWHHGAASPRVRLGVPLPFSLPDLANLLTGREKAVFGTSYLRLDETKQGPGFVLDGELSGYLLLDTQGRVCAFDQMQLNHGQGWKIDFQYDEQGDLHKLDLTNHKGERLLLLVKNRENPGPFTESQLTLSAPPGYPLLPLEKYANR
ncbi:MAG: hypothetical protein IKN64_01755 [Desulfovibrio sp.]|nr:hypothetical protein [Desulfovibrio sp.]